MNWKIGIGIIIAFISLIWSIVNTLIGRYVATKITKNDLAHLTKDVSELKTEEKLYKKDIKDELHDISLTLRRVEKRVIKNSTLIDVITKK